MNIFAAAITALLLITSIEVKAQSIMDFGTGTGSQSSGTGFSAANAVILGGSATGPSIGSFFYGFSSTGSVIQAVNPGLLNLGTSTELQASAGSTGNFTKWGTYNFISGNVKSSFNKFEFVLGDANGGNTATSGVWYFITGEGGKSTNFMFNNTTPLKIQEAGVALQFTFGTSGSVTAKYYDYSIANWVAIPNFTFVQGVKYSIEIYSDNDKTGTLNYTRNGTTYTLNWGKMDIWVNGSRIANQINVSQYIGQSGTLVGKIDSYCFYGEGSTSAYMFVDNINGAQVGAISSLAYYSKPNSDLSVLTNWGTVTDGTGSPPANFTSAYCSFFVRNSATQTIGAPLNISGFDSKLIIGDSVNAINFIIPSNSALTATVDVVNNGTLTIQNAATPVFGTLMPGSTVNYGFAGSQNIAYPTFHNLKTSGTGTKTLTTNVTAAGTITVGDGTNAGTLTTSTFTLTGAVNVSNNGTLELLTNGSSPTFGTIGSPSTVIYGSATAGQKVLAANYNNLTISGSTKVFADTTSSIGVSGTLSPGTTSGHTVTGSKINFNGSSAQTFSSTNYGFTFNKLTVSNLAGLTVSTDITVNDSLNLTTNPTSTKGALDMSSNSTLNMGVSAINTGTGDVTGIISRAHTFTVGEAYTFGSRFTTINFEGLSGKTRSSSIKSKVTIGTAPSWKTLAVKRVYSFAQTGGNDAVILNLRYLDSELQSPETDENKLTLWDAHDGPGFATFHTHGKSNNSTVDNWVGQSNKTIDYIAPSTSLDNKQWGLAYSDLTKITWIGGYSSFPNEWNNANNWSGGGVPKTTDDVLIPNVSGDGGSNQYPSLTLNVEVKTLEIAANASVTANNFNITINGNGGAWLNSGTFNPGTGTVIFTNTSAPVNITGTNQFNNLTIQPSVLLTPSSNSVIKVSGAITNNGTFNCEGTPNTIEYNGANQTVIKPNGSNTGYHNLTLSGSGTKTMPSGSLSVGNNFVTSGTITASALGHMTVGVDFTLGANTTFNAGTNYSHSVGGNFTNSGTFSKETSTFTFNGSSSQTIGGNNATTFHNFTVNNSNGVVMNKNVTVDGTLTLTSGALSIGSNTLTVNNAVSRTSGSITGGSSSNLVVGDAGSAASTTLPGITSLNNFTLNRSNGVSMGGNIAVNGTLILTSGVLSIGSNTLTINNALSNPSNLGITGGISSNLVIGDAGSAAAITLPNVSGGLNNMTINRGNGATTGGSLTLNGTLTLTNGKVTIGDNNLTASTLSGGSSASYVVTSGLGSFTLKRLNNSDNLIPVGVSASSYNPATIKNSGVQRDFTVRVTIAYPKVPSDSNKSVPRIWEITPSATGNRYNVKLQFNASDYTGKSFNPANPVFAGNYFAGDWNPIPASVSGSGPYVASINSVLNNSVLAIGNSDAFAIYAQNFDGTWIDNNGGTRAVPDNNWTNNTNGTATGNNSWRRNDEGSFASWTNSLAGTVKPWGNTGGSANFHTYDATNGSSGNLDLNLDLSTPGNKLMTFDYTNATGNDVLAVQLSTNGGTNFSSLATFTTCPWKKQTVNLGNVTSATSVIRFKATSDFGTTDIGLDNVRIIVGNAPAIDAGTLSIDIPSQISGTVTPKATVKNFGTSAQTFDVIMKVDNVTYGTATVTNLAAGAETQVSFDPWSPLAGSFTVEVCTNLLNDENSYNNFLTKYVDAVSTGYWKVTTNSTTQLLGSGCTYDDGTNKYLISIGGYTTPDTTACYKFNFTTETWTTLPSLTQIKRVLATAVIGDYVYAIGGRGVAFNTYRDSVFRLNLRSTDAGNKWVPVASLPEAVGWGKAVAYNNRYIYLAGGYNGTTILDKVYLYDTLSNTWTLLSNRMPGQRFDGAFSISGNKLVYIAGADGNYTLTNTVFQGLIDTDPTVVTWNQMASTHPGNGKPVIRPSKDNLLEPDFEKIMKGEIIEKGDGPESSFPAGSLYALDAAPWGTSQIAVSGGSPTSQIIPNDPTMFHLYNPATDTWTEKPEVPIPAAGTSIGSIISSTSGGTTWKFVTAYGSGLSVDLNTT